MTRRTLEEYAATVRCRYLRATRRRRRAAKRPVPWLGVRELFWVARLARRAYSSRSGP